LDSTNLNAHFITLWASVSADALFEIPANHDRNPGQYGRHVRHDRQGSVSRS